MTVAVRGVRSGASGANPGFRARTGPRSLQQGGGAKPPWFKARRYRHLDLPVDESFARKVQDPDFVAKHPFSPLIHYDRVERPYKKDPTSGKRKTERKPRPIKYASHRDACILAYYAHRLNEALEDRYRADNTGENVIAYRALRRSNSDFAAEAYAFAQAQAPVMILAFDVSKFFDRLDHGLLKRRLKSVLGVLELPEDWYRVFQNITRFHYVERSALEAHEVFGPRLQEKGAGQIASVKEVREAGIEFHPNPELANGYKRGIPQGTPISAAASNAYMVEFDADARTYCDGIGAFYRRYSDDILVICKPEHAAAAEARIMDLIGRELLEINARKTERTLFDALPPAQRTTKPAQYLGFTLGEEGPALRERTLANQWRKMIQTFRRERKAIIAKIAQGQPATVRTKNLQRRFAPIKVHDGQTTRAVRNFSSYARRSADTFGGEQKIGRQVKKLERTAQQEIQALKRLGPPAIAPTPELAPVTTTEGTDAPAAVQEPRVDPRAPVGRRR